MYKGRGKNLIRLWGTNGRLSIYYAILRQTGGNDSARRESGKEKARTLSTNGEKREMNTIREEEKERRTQRPGHMRIPFRMSLMIKKRH